MAKFELSIHEDYLAGRWGTWEGIREVVQNALDAQGGGRAQTTSRHG